MKDITLPGARAALVGAGNLTEPSFYKWMQAVDRNVTANTSSGDGSAAQIKAIALKLGSPDGSVASIPPQGVDAVINGGGSIDVDGTLENGIVNITLMYDTLLPGPTTYYGADSAGKRGWFPVSAALADSTDITVVTDSDTGVSAFELVNLDDEGTGDLLAITRDAKGRIQGTRPVIGGDGIEVTDAGSFVTIDLVGIPVHMVSQTGDQLTDQAGNILIAHESTSLPVDWTDVEDTPTTLDGYGVTDAQKLGDPVYFPPYTLVSVLAGTPPAAGNQYKAIYVTGLTGGDEPCISDGTNWRRFSDKSIAN